jgi:hypothetical protein
MISVETGISPLDLIEAPDGVLEAMVIYLKEQSKKQGKA